MITLAGLVSPEVVRIRATSAAPAEAFARVLDELEPDYLVLRSFEADENESFFGGPLAATDAQRAAFARYREVARSSAPEADAELWGRLAHPTVLEREPWRGAGRGRCSGFVSGRGDASGSNDREHRPRSAEVAVDRLKR